MAQRSGTGHTSVAAEISTRMVQLLARGMRTLFVATLLNPKGLLFAGTIFPAVAFAHLPAYAFSMLMFACLLVPIALAWIAFGAALGSGRLTWLNPVKMQRGASIVLGVFSLSLAWAALH